MRGFARAKAEYDAHIKSKVKNKPPLERTAMINLVEEIAFEAVRGAIQSKG